MNKLVNLKNNLRLDKIIFPTLILLGILSLLIVLQPEPIQTKSSKIASSPIPTVQSSSKPFPVKTANPANTPTPTASSVSSQQSVPQPIPTPIPTPVITTNEVRVSINGSSNFTVSVSEGDNLCDVLSKALEQGKISSLNMRYDKTYETYAVYQINGVGKENSVWWVYTVNEKSPSKGCSYIKANNNDSVEWKYMGS